MIVKQLEINMWQTKVKKISTLALEFEMNVKVRLVFLLVSICSSTMNRRERKFQITGLSELETLRNITHWLCGSIKNIPLMGESFGELFYEEN